MQWRAPGGETFPSVSESRNLDDKGLFAVAASVVIRDTSVRNVSCCIQNTLLSQEKAVEVSIPGEWDHGWVPTWHSFRTIIGDPCPA